MKSIFLEGDRTPDKSKMWLDLLKDYNLPITDHICDITNAPKELVIQTILKADSVSFCCSFVPSYKTTELIEQMMKFFLQKKVTGKRIVSCMEFLNALNHGDWCFDNPKQYAEVFDKNEILELSEGEIFRIVHDGHKFVYLPTSFKHKCDK